MIFVTGGTGMLGAHLLLDLTKNGSEVRALKRKNSDLTTVKKIFSWYTSDAEKLFGQIEWVEGELSDKGFLGKYWQELKPSFMQQQKSPFIPKTGSGCCTKISKGPPVWLMQPWR